MLRRQAVVDRHADESGFGQPIGNAVEKLLAAAAPTATMNHQHAGKRAFANRGINVGLLGLSLALDKGHVARDLEVQLPAN